MAAAVFVAGGGKVSAQADREHMARNGALDTEQGSMAIGLKCRGNSIDELSDPKESPMEERREVWEFLKFERRIAFVDYARKAGVVEGAS